MSLLNKLTIIGNLTRDPQLRTTSTGVNVCDFTVAVNRRQSAQQKANGQQAEADFFRVTAWRELGENCAKYLAKGRKVAVIGSVSVSMYTGNNNMTRANLEVTADEVEFLTPRDAQSAPADQNQGTPAAAPAPAQTAAAAPQGFTAVETDELPF